MHDLVDSRRGRVEADAGTNRRIDAAIGNLERLLSCTAAPTCYPRLVRLAVLGLLVACHSDPVSAPISSHARSDGGARFTLPAPPGLKDITSEYGTSAEVKAVYAAAPDAHGLQTIIVGRLMDPPGSFAEPAACSKLAEVIARGDAEPTSDYVYKVRTAAIVDGPVGKACQFDLAGPGTELDQLVTELAPPGHTRATPKEVLLFKCQYPRDDREAVAACRSALATFRLRE